MSTERDDYDLGWIGREADEQTLEDARAVMRKRRPDKKHWMLLDSRAEQEAWDANYRSIDPEAPWPWKLKVVSGVIAAILGIFVILAARGLIAYVSGV